jgi:hypothetical protein
MSLPDYPISVARDRFGLWLHVTGLSFRQVVQTLPDQFRAEAYLVYDPDQLTYTTSDLIETQRGQGRSRDELFAEAAALDADAFWNTAEPLFENDSVAVWPAECLDEMLRVQGSRGGCFGLCPVTREAAAALPADFVYEHPSNVEARLSFLSTDDNATSVFVADEGDLLRLVRRVVELALATPEAEGLDEVARGLRPWLEEGGVDIRANPHLPHGDPHRTATVAIGQWTLRSQWPLLWRRVPVCEIGWDGRRWTLSEVRHVPGRQFVAPVRLVGELFHWTGYATRYAVVFGLPLAAALLMWATAGWVGGLIALVVAIVLWPRFVLGTSWHTLRQRRAEDEALRRKYD